MPLLEFIAESVLVHPVSSKFNYRFLSKLQSNMIINILSSVVLRFDGFEVRRTEILQFDGSILPPMDFEIIMIGG